MTLYDEGTYRARAVQGSAMLGYSSRDTEQVAVLLRFVDGPYAQHTIGWYGYFSDKTMERTIESLRYMGWRGDDMFDLSTVGDDQAEDVDIVIEHETNDDGEVRARVRWINKPGGGIALKKPMTEAQAKAFATRMRGAVVAYDRKAGQPKNNGGVGPQRRPDRAEPPPHKDDDNIPF